MDIDKSISRTILTLPGLKVTMGVVLSDDDIMNPNQVGFYNGKIKIGTKQVSDTETHLYYDLSYVPFVTIKPSWKLYHDRGRSAMIVMTQKNQHTIVKGFKRMVRRFYEEDMFFEREGVLKAYATKDEWVEYIRTDKDSILLTPITITDQSDGIVYEGVNMVVNKQDINIGMSIDELETLTYTLEHVDMFLYSQAIINAYLAIKSARTLVLVKNTEEAMQYIDRETLFKDSGAETKKEVVETSTESLLSKLRGY